MRKFLVAAAIAALVTGPAFAQVPQTQPAPPKAATPAALPAARTIIDRHVEVIGGRAAVLSHASTRATGAVTVPGPGMSGTFEMLAAKPDKVLVRMTLAGIGETVDGFDGTTGWNMSPVTGPALSLGKELEQKKFDADFYGDLRDPKRYVSIKTVDKTSFDGRECYKISLVRAGGGEDFEFYDVATGLKAGTIASRETQMGTVTVTETRGEYKKFGNLLQPTVLKQNAMGIQLVLTVTALEYDSVPANAFEPPAAIKALIK